MIATLSAMTSGEVRWIGRPDLHVQCWAPCDLVPMPHGRDGWVRRSPVFRIITADTTTEWVEAAVAVRQIEALIAQEPRHVA